MTLHLCSSARRGLFISVDGPSGAGNSTVVGHLAQMLAALGEKVHVTAEPSDGPIGQLCRTLTETVTGTPSPACTRQTGTTTSRLRYGRSSQPEHATRRGRESVEVF
jgi:thymidylate kinase